MKIKQLEYVIKIAECGSFSKAADMLYVSQPSLTKAVNNIESEYHTKLFARKSKGVELTLEGKRFVHYAKSVVDAASVLEHNFLVDNSFDKKCLFVASQQLDFVYPALRNTYNEMGRGDLHYKLEETNRDEIIRLLVNGNTNIGLYVRSKTDFRSLLWQSEYKNLEQTVIQQGCYYVLVGPKSSLFEKKQITFSETRRFTNIGLDLEGKASAHLIIDNSEQHFNLNQMIFLNTTTACEEFLVNTDAVLFATEWTVGCFKNPLIRVLELSDDGVSGPPSGVELVWAKRSGYPLDEVEEYFLKQVYEKMGKRWEM